MSEIDTQPEETTEDQPEQTQAAEAPFNSALAEKVAAYRAEILGKAEEPEEEPDELEAQEPQEEDQEPEEEDPEAEKVRLRFEAEQRAREEREQLKAEREAWQEEQREQLEAVAKYQASIEEIEFDPLGHLEAAGLSDDALMDLGREIFFRFMPEHVTPDIKAEMAAKNRERRLMRMERRWEKQQKAADEPKKETEPPKAEEPSPEYLAYEAQYKEGLAAEAAAVSAESFPLAAAFSKEELSDAMFAAASDHVRTSPGTGDLTPAQALQAVEKFLQDNPQFQKKSEAAPTQTTKQPEKTRPKQTAPRSLRNRQVVAKPTQKEPQTFEEKLAARERQIRENYGF